MASNKKLKTLIGNADKAPRSGFGGWLPEDGEKIVFKVVKANTKMDKAGLPQWGLQLEVLKSSNPDSVGKRRWFDQRFSEEWEFITQRTIDNMKVLGVSADTLADADPAVIVEMVSGKTGVAVISVRDSDDPRRPWVNADFEASRMPTKPKKGKKGKKKREEPEPEEDDDFDDDFDDIDEDDLDEDEE